MKSFNLKTLIASVCLFITPFVYSETLVLTSTDIAAGEFMPKAQEFKGFDCNGENTSPQLSWRGAPKDTKAFALLVHDPDAPTGSGWWHWQLVNIPADVTSLPKGAGNSDTLLPNGALHIRNDYGVAGFGGACPPKGHGVHRYQFTLHALSQELSLPDAPSSALVGYMVNSYSIASYTLEALYKRD